MYVLLIQSGLISRSGNIIPEFEGDKESDNEITNEKETKEVKEKEKQIFKEKDKEIIMKKEKVSLKEAIQSLDTLIDWCNENSEVDEIFKLLNFRLKINQKYSSK